MNVGRVGGLDVRVRETEIKEKGWTDKNIFFIALMAPFEMS